jgi:KaiC/GvpD/RAD55 family RecA-like ATPase
MDGNIALDGSINWNELEKETPRIESGVEGLDEALKGGLPADNIILLTGTPGSGKTTIALQFLMHSARKKVPSIYFTLEESTRDLIKQFIKFDPGMKDVLMSGMLKIVEVPLIDYESFKENLGAEIDAIGAQRVVIDSISYLQMFFVDIVSIRKGIIELSALLKSKNVFGIFIGEIPYGEDKLSTYGVEEFATDGVISVHMMEKQDAFIRALRVVKMRGTDHMTKFIPMEITEKGVVIYPKSQLFSEMQ